MMFCEEEFCFKKLKLTYKVSFESNTRKSHTKKNGGNINQLNDSLEISEFQRTVS